MTAPTDDMTEAYEELRGVRTSLTYHVSRALIGWAIRWTIGFGLIWAITGSTGRFDWLWTAGVIVAGISLATILAFRFWTYRRAQETQSKLEKLARLVEEQERREDQDNQP